MSSEISLFPLVTAFIGQDTASRFAMDNSMDRPGTAPALGLRAGELPAR